MKINKETRRNMIKALTAAVTVTVAAVVLVIYSMASNADYLSYRTDYISPAGITVSGDAAYVADATNGKLYKTSVSGKNVQKTWDAGDAVNGVVVNGNDVYALSGELNGKITKLDNNLNVVVQEEAGHTPTAAVFANGKIYVANRFSSNITVHNASDLSVVATVDVGREPVAMEVSGNNLYIARHLINGAANGEVASSDVVVVDIANNNVVKTIPLLNGSSLVNDICIYDGYIYVSGTIGRYSYPFTQIDRAWIVSNGLNIISMETNEVVTAVLLDEVDLGAANPWGIDCTDNGKLVVSIAGTNEAIIIDTTEMWSQINKVISNSSTKLVKTVNDIPNYLPFLDSSRTRVKLDGIGPRSLEVAGNKAYICQYFTGNIAVLDIDNKIQSENETISLGTQPEADKVREGEILWNDGTECYQQWLSCASCHPDARTDGLNWADADKPHTNTKSMVFSERTPPVLTRGTAVDTYANIVGSYNVDYYTYLTDEQYDAVDRYLKALTPVQSPYLNRDGSLTESAQRGKELFESQGCASCHPAPIYTDLTMRKPRAAAGNWETQNPDTKFDTPSLVEIWRSAPFMNDGSIAGLKDAVIANLKPDHGLTNGQIEDLTNFVGSIGTENEIYGIDVVTFKDKEENDVYVKLNPGTTLKEITVCNQWESNSTAKVTFTLYKDDGAKITEVSETLRKMSTNEMAVISLNVEIPDNLTAGSYYIISITDSASGENLATDYRVTY